MLTPLIPRTPRSSWLLAFLVAWLCSGPEARGAAPARLIRDEAGDPVPAGAWARLGTRRFRAHSPLYSLDWSKDKPRIASGHHGRLVAIWHAENGHALSTDTPDMPPDHYRPTLFTHGSSANVLFLPGSDVLAMRCNDHHLLFLDLLNGKKTALALEGSTHGPIVRHTASTIALGAAQSAFIIDAKKRRIAKKVAVEVFPQGLRTVAFSPDGDTIATTRDTLGDESTLVYLWSLKTGKKLGTLTGHQYPVTSLAFSADGTRLFSGDGFALRAWDVPSLKEVQKIASPAGRLALSPDGKILATFNEGSSVRLRRTDTLKSLREINLVGGATAVAFSPDSKRIATGGHLHSIRIWDIASGKEIGARPGHHGAVLSLRFSPDGKTLASRGADNSLRLWNTRTGSEARVLSLGEADRYEQTASGGVFPPLGSSLAWS
ncbi:MAG: hypothetical protein K2W96_00005, partial [Gemmataceae bacterium]|nr:hypothetical protein [Gemmataceae bacterium]